MIREEASLDLGLDLTSVSPKCAISQAATSQMYIFPKGNFPIKEKKAIPCFKENIVNYLGKFLLGKIYIRENAGFPSWGSYHLGNCH